MREFLVLIIAYCALGLSAQAQVRVRELFNENWTFQKGENPEASSRVFSDKEWRKLSLPHDWAIEGPFSEHHDMRTGALPISGVAWYRKSFDLPAQYEGKKITVEFDGVMSNSSVYINGHLVGERPYGYIGFEVDLTPYVSFDKPNVIAVRCAPEELSSRWYPGAGIYRNVWFEVKNPVHVGHWGTYITTPEVSDEEATVAVETTLDGNHQKGVDYKLRSTIVDAKNKVVAQETQNIEFSYLEDIKVVSSFTVEEPTRWDIDNPYLYSLKTELIADGKVVDDYSSTFGIRTIEFTRNDGFLLNGRRVNFQGVCLHHDLGPLGAAVNLRATERQLEIMKEMGVNAIRTSHNPSSREQIELCDRMGILVQVEAFDGWKIPKVANDYSKYWDEWHERDLRDVIRRDRNHPSVVMWSIGNEMKEQQKAHGGAMAQALTDICHDEDPTRPTTAGFNNYPQCVNNGLAAGIDVVGFNYKPTQYDDFLAKNPDAIVYGSETSSCVSSRGVYHLPVENYDTHPSLQITSYDIVSPPWAYPPDFEIEAQKKMNRSLGEFIWTGFDYIGEPTPFNGKDNETHGRWTGDWPSRSSYFGAVDLCGIPKDRFYFYQSVWTDKPMVHILPHWNWENAPVDTIPVYCYTNCDEAELFLNGKSLGRKRMGEDKTTIPAVFNWWLEPETTWDSPFRLNWNVAYEPGVLEVKAYKGGKLMATKRIVTASEPYTLKLESDRKRITADGLDLAFVTVSVVDKDGNLVPEADNQIDFEVSGSGIFKAVGNGNAATTESFQEPTRKAFSGKCMLIVAADALKKGDIKITATSKGLKSKSLSIKTSK